MEIPKYITYKLQPGEVNAIKDKLIAFNLTAVAYRVSTIEPTKRQTQIIRFRKEPEHRDDCFGADSQDLEPVDKLANDYGINVAIGGSMQVALAAVNGRSKQLDYPSIPDPGWAKDSSR